MLLYLQKVIIYLIIIPNCFRLNMSRKPSDAMHITINHLEIIISLSWCIHRFSKERNVGVQRLCYKLTSISSNHRRNSIVLNKMCIVMRVEYGVCQQLSLAQFNLQSTCSNLICSTHNKLPSTDLFPLNINLKKSSIGPVQPAYNSVTMQHIVIFDVPYDFQVNTTICTNHDIMRTTRSLSDIFARKETDQVYILQGSVRV